MQTYIENKCSRVKNAVKSIATSSTAKKNSALTYISESLCDDKVISKIIEANQIDISKANENGIVDAMIDRLRLDEKRIKSISNALLKICDLPDPIGSGECWTRPNGLQISKVHVPIGVIGVIYESRPNVTIDAAALCIKTGNAVILRGGKEAIHTNTALVEIMKLALEKADINSDILEFIDNTSREGVNILMQMNQYIDLLIPRGGASLIRNVIENSNIPVIETGAGNCHCYVDEYADLDMAINIAVNEKTSRPAVCNSIETLLVHEKIACTFLPLFAEKVQEYSVDLRGCDKTKSILSNTCLDTIIKTATEDDYKTEYSDFILAVKVVSSIDEAITHINKYSTNHSESIITNNMSNAELFKQTVDSAVVYVNASTRFTDGEEFGFGAEIGISTQKLHARGPVGLNELTTIKYMVTGTGQIR